MCNIWGRLWAHPREIPPSTLSISGTATAQQGGVPATAATRSDSAKESEIAVGLLVPPGRMGRGKGLLSACLETHIRSASKEASPDLGLVLSTGKGHEHPLQLPTFSRVMVFFLAWVTSAAISALNLSTSLHSLARA